MTRASGVSMSQVLAIHGTVMKSRVRPDEIPMVAGVII